MAISPFQLWVEYFKTKDSVSAVIPAANYKDLVSNTERFPTVRNLRCVRNSSQVFVSM